METLIYTYAKDSYLHERSVAALYTPYVICKLRRFRLFIAGMSMGLVRSGRSDLERAVQVPSQLHSQGRDPHIAGHVEHQRRQESGVGARVPVDTRCLDTRRTGEHVVELEKTSGDSNDRCVGLRKGERFPWVERILVAGYVADNYKKAMPSILAIGFQEICDLTAANMVSQR